MKTKHLFLSLAAAVLLASCGEENTDYIFPDDDTPEQPSNVAAKGMSTPQFFFGFVGQDRYSYCPTVMQTADGTVHAWFCGNPVADQMVDNVYHVTQTDGTVSSAVSVLQPGAPGTWDSHHTCDPSVVEGQFRMGGTTYKYAMFYLGCSLEYYYNEVGVAFSNDLNATTWVKYPKQIVRKTWPTEGDQDLGGGNKSWGVGQPAAISLDKKGKVLLAYTLGDAGGTYEMWRECDLSDMDNPVVGSAHRIPNAGLVDYDGTNADYITDIDLAVDEEHNRIVMIRPVHAPGNIVYPTYIEPAVEIDYMNYDDFKASKGSWTSLFRVTKAQSGFARNHNPGLQTDSYGYITDYLHPVFFYTVSKEAPDVAGQAGKQAEWTYHIYRSQIIDKK